MQHNIIQKISENYSMLSLNKSQKQSPLILTNSLVDTHKSENKHEFSHQGTTPIVTIYSLVTFFHQGVAFHKKKFILVTFFNRYSLFITKILMLLTFLSLGTDFYYKYLKFSDFFYQILTKSHTLVSFCLFSTLF